MSIRDSMIASWFLPESFYRIGDGRTYPNQAEFICPQAFGRNTYSDKNVCTVRRERNAISNDIATFEWLKIRHFDPGQPNQILAQRCIRLAKYNAPKHLVIRPIIGQWEVLYAMWLIEPNWYAEHQEILFPIWPPIAGKWTTRAMMLTAFSIAEAHCLRIPLIVAHPEHIQRCFFIARKIFGVAATDIHDPSKEWYDRSSLQWQTRGPNLWLVYEMLARIRHRFYGWI